MTVDPTGIVERPDESHEVSATGYVIDPPDNAAYSAESRIGTHAAAPRDAAIPARSPFPWGGRASEPRASVDAREIPLNRRAAPHPGQGRPRLAMRHLLSLPGSARTAHAPCQVAVIGGASSRCSPKSVAIPSRSLSWNVTRDLRMPHLNDRSALPTLCGIRSGTQRIESSVWLPSQWRRLHAAPTQEDQERRSLRTCDVVLLRGREFDTTLTLLGAIARPAIIGLRSPKTGPHQLAYR
jgi:hypothetical protein